MSDDQYMSDPVTAECDFMPGDGIAVRRVGIPGDDDAVVSVDITVGEGQWDEDGRWITSVLLTPMDARRIAAALLDFADDCDGQFSSFLPPGPLYMRRIDEN